MIEVKLLAPHTHAGQQLKKGDVITVTEMQKQWLVNRGIATVQPNEKQTKGDK